MVKEQAEACVLPRSKAGRQLRDDTWWSMQEASGILAGMLGAHCVQDRYAAARALTAMWKCSEISPTLRAVWLAPPLVHVPLVFKANTLPHWLTPHQSRKDHSNCVERLPCIDMQRRALEERRCWQELLVRNVSQTFNS